MANCGSPRPLVEKKKLRGQQTKNSVLRESEKISVVDKNIHVGLVAKWDATYCASCLDSVTLLDVDELCSQHHLYSDHVVNGSDEQLLSVAKIEIYTKC